MGHRMGVGSQFLDGPVVQSPTQPCAELVFGVFDEQPAGFFGDAPFSDTLDDAYPRVPTDSR